MEEVEVTLADGTHVMVPCPRVPPKPHISRKDRQEMARQWLRQLSQSATDERVNELAPFVGRFHAKTGFGRIASQLVAQNRLPTRRAVVYTYLQKRAQDVRTREEAAARADEFLHNSETAEAQILELIDHHWDMHGSGPTWGLVGLTVGLDRTATSVMLERLRSAGLVAYSQEQGSLHTVKRSAGQ